MLHFKQKKLNFTISCLAFGFKITQEISSMLIQLRPHSEMGVGYYRIDVDDNVSVLNMNTLQYNRKANTSEIGPEAED